MVRLTAFLLLIPLVAVADVKLDNSSARQTQILDQQFDPVSTWNVTKEDWSRYQSIMQGKGQFYWKHLDPVTVLGLNARSESERNRYAEIIARNEFENALSLSLLDTAYNEAFKRLYGNIPVIDASKLINKNEGSFLSKVNVKAPDVPKFGDRYVAFVNTQCKECDALIADILKTLPEGVALDIHFQNDARVNIFAWAKKLKISPKLVEDKLITLNPNSTLFTDFKITELPSLFYFSKGTNQVSEIR